MPAVMTVIPVISQYEDGFFRDGYRSKIIFLLPHQGYIEVYLPVDNQEFCRLH